MAHRGADECAWQVLVPFHLVRVSHNDVLGPTHAVERAANRDSLLAQIREQVEKVGRRALPGGS